MEARQEWDQAKEQIKSRLDLVRIVGETVALKRSGRSFKGLCPFHEEKTPSFHVFPDSQHFKCFGCGQGGDVFSWTMARESLEFGPAMRLLAERASVTLPNAGADGARAARRRAEQNQLSDVVAAVQAFFAEQLKSREAEAARRYLQERELSEAIAPFGLGYAPGPVDGNAPIALATWFERRELPVEAGVQLGVLGRSQRGMAYDRFRNRVTFPIQDERGRIVGFGARILPGHESEREPKYLNSPSRRSSTSGAFSSGCTRRGNATPSGSSSSRAIPMSSARNSRGSMVRWRRSARV